MAIIANGFREASPGGWTPIARAEINLPQMKHCGTLRRITNANKKKTKKKLA